VSKKKFTGGLDTLFEVTENVLESTPSVSSQTRQPENVSTTQSGMARRVTSKNFTSDLDSLFQEAFTEAVEEKLEKMKRTSGTEDPFQNNPRPAYKQPLSGLDALIRSTVDTSLAGLDHAAIKRLTIMFENQKIEKLKSIAKVERSFVKDLVSGVLTEFINDYEKRTGKSF
jgi:hypothetical protein